MVGTMAKFNRSVRTATFSPVASEATPSGTTYEGAPGYARDVKGELFLLGVANMVAEDTFYEGASERDARFRSLVIQAAAEDPQWTTDFLRWLRADGNMRSAPIVAAAEIAHIQPKGIRPRPIVDAVLQRADEPGEIVAYYMSRYGRALPKPLKRGVADAVQRLYNERSLLKYDTSSASVRFGDVLDLVHPSPDPAKRWQGDLFKHALDRRHGRDNPIPDSLHTLIENEWATRSLTEDPQAFLRVVNARLAAFTWENVLSLLGNRIDKRVLWEAVIPSMGYMALLRNLRNFDEAGVSDEVAERIGVKLADPDEVARSRQFPFRFLAAYNAAPSLRWGHALEKALGLSLANVPALKGSTLILVDRSGSMFHDGISKRSGLSRADAAAVFGSALALRAEHPRLVQFGTSHEQVRFTRATSLLKLLGKFGSMGGTQTAEAVRGNYHGHDRVVIVTDEQAWGGYYGGDPTDVVPPHVPVYTWNLAGYRYGHGPSGADNRHTFGGLTDAAFRMIPLLEAGRNASWPWTTESSYTH